MRWKYELDVRDLFKNGRDTEDKDIPGISEEVVRRIKRGRAYTLHSKELQPICRRLGRVKTLDGFNKVWNVFYDWADVNGLWVRTF